MLAGVNALVATTDAQGNFTFTDVPPGDVTVTLRPAGHILGSAQVVIEQLGVVLATVPPDSKRAVFLLHE